MVRHARIRSPVERVSSNTTPRRLAQDSCGQTGVAQSNPVRAAHTRWPGLASRTTAGRPREWVVVRRRSRRAPGTASRRSKSLPQAGERSACRICRTIGTGDATLASASWKLISANRSHLLKTHRAPRHQAEQRRPRNAAACRPSVLTRSYRSSGRGLGVCGARRDGSLALRHHGLWICNLQNLKDRQESESTQACASCPARSSADDRRY